MRKAPEWKPQGTKQRNRNVNVVVGLGNPGRRYVGTPHNVGFVAVDRLAGESGCRFRRSARFRALTAKTRMGGQPVLLVKPQTYMNASGEAVGALLRYHKVEPAEVLVLLDDVDLDVGRLRVRASGGSGGHRGLASVIQHVGTKAFARIRMGVGRGPGERDVVSHVLSSVPAAHRERVEMMTARAAEAVRVILESGVNAAMNQFNSALPGES